MSVEEVAPADVFYRQYENEEDLPLVMTLIDNELSEPYSIFTYRYFLHSWPQLCYCAFVAGKPVGTVVCKSDMHGEHTRGYLAMLVVDKAYRKLGIGSVLVKKALEAMVAGGCEEVVLEAEVTNHAALNLYHNLGFIRDKRLHRHYLNGSDAYRLKLLLPLAGGSAGRQDDNGGVAEPLQGLANLAIAGEAIATN